MLSTIPGITTKSQTSEEIELRKTELMYMSWYIKLLEMKEKGYHN